MPVIFKISKNGKKNKADTLCTDLFPYASFQNLTAPEVSSPNVFAVYTVRLPSNGSTSTFVLAFTVPQMNGQFHPSGFWSSSVSDQKNILPTLYNFSASCLVQEVIWYCGPKNRVLVATRPETRNCFVLVIFSVMFPVSFQLSPLGFLPSF